MSLLTRFRSLQRVKSDLSRTRRPPHRPTIEYLEDRTLFAGHTLFTATALPFFATTPVNTATTSGFLSSSTDVDLYAVNLNADDQLTASAAAQSVGSGLHSYRRLFSSSGQPMFAVDDPSATLASLSVQVSTTGTYYLGVSISGNDTYDPTVAPSAGDTTQTGLYTLNLSRPATPPAPVAAANLVPSQFQVFSGPAVWGQTISVSYQIDNRGADGAGSITAQVMLASSTPETNWWTS